MEKELFGVTAEGCPVFRYWLSNRNGMRVAVLTLGGIVQSILVPDRNSVWQDVVLGYETVAEYERDTAYLGACLGRAANRIAGGKFTLQGRVYELTCNNGKNHLHGGNQGFHRFCWEDTPVSEAALLLRRTSPDGEEGYPGNVTVTVCYSLAGDNTLTIEYRAVSDADTILNLSNHTYFNLEGLSSEDVTEHLLYLAADWMTPVDEALLPDGSILPVEGTRFDFRSPKVIGQDIGAVSDEQIRWGNGYDHNFIIRDSGFRQAAVITAPDSGISLEVRTDQPGVQVYTGNGLAGAAGKGARKHRMRSAVCLETQNFPDAVNQPAFPSPILAAGEEYHTRTAYRFDRLQEQGGQMR